MLYSLTDNMTPFMHYVSSAAARVTCPTEGLYVYPQISKRWVASDSGTAPPTVWHTDSNDADGTWTAIGGDAVEGEVGSHCKPTCNGSVDPRRQRREGCVGFVLVGDDASRPRDVYVRWANEEGSAVLNLGIALDVAGEELADWSIDYVTVDDGVPRNLEPVYISLSIALVADPQRLYALSAGNYRTSFKLGV